MKSLFAALWFFAFLTLPGNEAGAGGRAEPPDPLPNADSIIKECFDRTIATSGPTTADMREANLNNVLCLENAIVEQFSVFDQDLKFHFAPDDKRPTTEKVRDKMRELRFSAGALYWWIYNEHPGCNLHCGTMYFTFHLYANAQILEMMLRDIVAQRLKYRF